MQSSACRGFDAVSLLRRDLLRVGGLGMLGVTLPDLLRAGESARTPLVDSIIFLFQFGGPSHHETFDMKPAAADGIRSQFRAASSSVPGLPICEHLPETAKLMHKLTLIRSVHHNMKNHNSAAYYALTGQSPPVDDIRLRDTLDLYPAYGSVVDRLSPASNGMPTFVAYPHVIRDGEVTPGQHASFLGKQHDPLLVTQDPNDVNFRLPELSLPSNLSVDRLRDRRELQRLINRQARLLDYSATAQGIDAYYERVLGMLNSPRVRQAFDLTAESAPTRERYGRTTYGQGCLLARRLAEAGVRFVTVYFSDSIGGQSTVTGGWDTHGFNDTRMYPILKARHLPITDQTLPVLVQDLDERGLLDRTLVVWMGEFGRTPRLNGNLSRDHWPQCYTVVLAGGPLRRGYVFGSSDKTGGLPDTNPVRPDDLAATMFFLLGIDPAHEVVDRLNRPLAVTRGQPIRDLLA